MKLYVPEIGDEIVLTKDWTFDLFSEDRNTTLATLHGYTLKYDHSESDRKWDEWVKNGRNLPYPEYNSLDNHFWVKEDSKGVHSIPITLPVGTVLKVDRIYVRKGSSDFSSLSFTTKSFGSVDTLTWNNKPAKRGVRFWARLSDCNNIEFDLK